MAYKITIEGDDKDELLEAAKGLVEMLGGEAEEEAEAEDETEEEETEETEEDETEEEETEDEDDGAELLGKIRKQIAKLVKTDEGPGKVKAAFAKVKIKKLDALKPKQYPLLAKLLGVKA